MSDAPPTPPPHSARGDEPSQQMRHECPYRDEVHLVQRLRALGVEEQILLGRRRDRVGSILGGAALAAVLALASWLYVDGRETAHDTARREVRIEMLERGAAESAPTASQLVRLNERLAGLEQRLGDRLTRIEERLDRAEAASRPRR
jgi:hypothetical protein